MKDKFLWLCFTVVLVADQLSKKLALESLAEGRPVSIVEGLFNLTLVYNPGAAFGMFAGLPDTQRRVTLLFVAFLALLAVFYMLRDTKGDRISQIALVCILGGAIGNIVDRFRFDAVVDFLDFYWGAYHWPAFNIADSAICLGVAVLMFRMLFPAKGSEIINPS